MKRDVALAVFAAGVLPGPLTGDRIAGVP